MSETKIKPYEKPENIINPNSEFSIEVQNLRKILRGNVRNEDNLVLMDLPDLQALYNEWDRINNVGDGEEMPIAVLNFNK